MMHLPFVKMHGLGNDYVYVDGFDVEITDPGAVARQVSDRHRGVGSDGLILLLPPVAGGDVRMRMFNADGSEAEMCGNGVRCLARLAFERGRADGPRLAVETGAGRLDVVCGPLPGDPHAAADVAVDVTVDMGCPIRACAAVPVDVAHLTPVPESPGRWRLEIEGEARGRLECRFVSMGNPHAVTFVDDVDAFPLDRIGPVVERHPAFPQRINLHVVHVRSRDHLVMRTWERGAGMTQACGTGACAVAVAAVDGGLADRKVRITLPGGDLDITWTSDDAAVMMRGPATRVFDGRIAVDA